MSKQTLIDELVENGYELSVLAALNHSELCLLKTQCATENAKAKDDVPKGYCEGTDMKVAEKVDLIVLPKGVKGTNCGNCRWVKNGFCEQPRVQQPVDAGLCCSLWDRKDIKRPWGKIKV